MKSTLTAIALVAFFAAGVAQAQTSEQLAELNRKVSNKMWGLALVLASEQFCHPKKKPDLKYEQYILDQMNKIDQKNTNNALLLSNVKMTEIGIDKFCKNIKRIVDTYIKSSK